MKIDQELAWNLKLFHYNYGGEENAAEEQRERENRGEGKMKKEKEHLTFKALTATCQLLGGAA